MAIPTKYEKIAFGIVFVLALYLSFLILKGYLTAILSGAIIAYFLYPLYSHVNKRVGSKNISAFVISFVSFIVIGGVIALTVPQVISETERLVDFSQQFLESQRQNLKECEMIQSLYCTLVYPYRDALEADELENNSANFIKLSSDVVLSSVTNSFPAILSMLIKLVVMGFSIFYFLEHGPSLVKKFLHILPMHQRHEDMLEKRVKQTMDAVIKGNVVTSIMQGALGGLMFYIVGITSPFMWGVFMTILAFIPAAGAALIWFPAGVILIITGNMIGGIALLVFGFFVLGYIDNILKPKMIGNKIQISSFMMFLSVIGGLSVFGMAGLFIGPLIISLTIVLIDFLEEVIHG